MVYPITKRLPCSVCGADGFRRHGWFLVVENRWLDRLRILTWHPSLAAYKEIKSACCRQHLKALLAHWLQHASLRPTANDEPPMPLTGPARVDIDLDPKLVGRLIGELSVHRDTFSHGWTGSPETLECILDALVPEPEETQTYAMEFQLCNPQPESSRGLALH